MHCCSVCLLSTLIILCSILGSYYLSRSQLYDNQYKGTLINTRIIPLSKHNHRNCNHGDCKSDDAGHDDTTYAPPPFHIVEIFQKNNSSDICELTRLTYYNTLTEAHHAIHKVKLGTTRTIWSYYGNSGQCYDETIKTYNFKVGLVLLSFVGLYILVNVITKMCNVEKDNVNINYGNINV